MLDPRFATDDDDDVMMGSHNVCMQMELTGTSCDFVCPVFAHAHEAVSREKGFIAVEARTTVELDQVCGWTHFTNE